MSKSANGIDLANQRLGNILAGEGPHQETSVTKIESVTTEEDRIRDHPMEIEGAENTQMKEKESIKIEIEIKSKAKEEIDQGPDKKNTENEDKVDLIRREDDENSPMSI